MIKKGISAFGAVGNDCWCGGGEDAAGFSARDSNRLLLDAGLGEIILMAAGGLLTGANNATATAGRPAGGA